MLGRCLALRLAGSGHPVLGLDLVPCPPLHPTIETVVVDVRDPHRLYRLFSERPVDAIAHGGGVSGSMVLREDPARIADINIGGTLNLLEAARFFRVPRFVQCSTIMVYGAALGAAVLEDRPLAPENVYGATKAACEALIHSYGAEFGLSAALLRIAHVYGPSRRTYCPVTALVAGALSGEPVALPDRPDTARQFIYEDDVAAAIELAIHDRAPGTQTVNIAPGAEWRTAELVAMVGEAVGPVAASYEGSIRPSDYAAGVLSVSRAAELWGWRPRVALEQGIERIARSLTPREGSGQPSGKSA
jgi:nucleoside-diphosphate-sugar epimerase